MNIEIIPPSRQASGSFDNGRITERKPIGFPGEGSYVDRLGPLFYWAWAHAHGESRIGRHPHRGYEIITYFVDGEGYHRDSMGTDSVIGAGGAQVMQTGSGVWHAEGSEGPMELFQIWFEPYYRDALQRTPTYAQFEPDQFPVEEADGVVVKTVLGGDSPIRIVADARMYDAELSPGASYAFALRPGRALAALAYRGEGGAVSAADGETAFADKDFIVVRADADGDEGVIFRAGGTERLRLFLIEVPAAVDYPLFNKSR